MDMENKERSERVSREGTKQDVDQRIKRGKMKMEGENDAEASREWR